MGAKPLFAMNIVGFPSNTLPMTVLEDILKGAHDKAAEAGISVIGGHTIEDPEPKYGMVVTGSIHPEKLIRNFGAKPGDILILTKPLGTGILSTAMKRGMLGGKEEKEVIKIMSTLNDKAAALMNNYDVHACTDVTGFGLLGHLREMSKASKCNVELKFNSLPFLDAASSLATAGVIPGGSYNNLDYVKADVDFGSYGRTQQLMMCDSQTSGGLLIALPMHQTEDCLAELIKNGVSKSAIIGRITEKGDGQIKIL